MTNTYIIGITGSVASGKSTFARVLSELLDATVVTTDDFLYPNEELERAGLLNKKGFPQSHNVERLREFLTDVRQGASENGIYSIPEYSHLQYNIIGRHNVTVANIIILEGVGLSEVTDLLDCLIFFDAPINVAFSRYLGRVTKLWTEAKQTGEGYFTQFADLTEAEFKSRCTQVWREVNLANYEQNILPLRSHADIIQRYDLPVSGTVNKLQQVFL